MPSVTKQSPNQRRPPAKPGSILSRARPVQELVEENVKMLIYGQNGVGKTTLACTFPKPLLLVDFEPNESSGGAQSVRRVEGVVHLRVANTEEALRLADELREDTYYRTHVLDSATSMQAMVLQDLLGLETLPQQLNFGTVSGDIYRARAEKTKEVLHSFMRLRAHTVLLAKERDHNPPKEERVNPKTGKVQPDMRPRFLRGIHNESFFAPEIGGATVSWAQDACNYLAQMTFAKEVKVEETTSTIGGKEMVHRREVETGRYVRVLRCQYHPNYAARFRSDTPERVPEFIEEPTWEKIRAVIQG